jgi:hypothetical protein
VGLQWLISCIIRIHTQFVNYLWYYSISKESRHVIASTFTTASIAYLVEKNMKTGGPSSHAVNFQIRKSRVLLSKTVGFSAGDTVSHLLSKHILLLHSSEYHNGSYNEPVTSNQQLQSTSSDPLQYKFSTHFCLVIQLFTSGFPTKFWSPLLVLSVCDECSPHPIIIGLKATILFSEEHTHTFTVCTKGCW